MYSGKIIDFHAHIFPDKIAKKATENIGRFYGIEMSGNGSVNALLQSASAFNVEKFIVHSTATTHRQVNAINDFIFDEISKECRRQSLRLQRTEEDSVGGSRLSLSYYRCRASRRILQMERSERIRRSR